jgi:hypothetical protein
MLRNNTFFFLLTVFFAFVIAGPAAAQTSISSPYSAFGIGNLSEVTNITSRSMGGIGIGIRDNFNVNISNPASYSGFDSTSFVFEGGAGGHFVNLSTSDLNESYSNATLTHLLFGFPVMKWWRSSFGLLPYSSMGYDAIDFSDPGDMEATQYVFEGEGGITQAFWGNSIQPHKNFSVGVNFAYLFGTTDRVQKVTFPKSANMISSLVNNGVTMNDVHFDFGAQYHPTLDSARGLQLVFGVTYSPEQEMSARRNTMVRSYLGELSGVPLIIDTISMKIDEKGIVVIPQTLGFGFSISRRNRWLLGADYEFGEWEKYSSFGRSDSLTNSHTFRMGGQMIPNPNSFSYIQRVEYRLGGHFSQSYLNLRNEQINGFGITFGLGLPVVRNMIRRTRSMVNFGFEIGKRGTLVNGLIQENYFNINIGISVYEWWFFKRRYQ